MQRIFILIIFFPPFFILQVLHWLGFLFDEILFPGFRRIDVQKPLFIIGIPRSGTTYLHRVLAADNQFTSLSTWECIFAPSITERKFLRGAVKVDSILGAPFARLVKKLQKSINKRFSSIHSVNLSKPEEDYLTLLPIFSCFILILAFPNTESLWRMASFDWDVKEKQRKKIMGFYYRCLQRHLYVHGPDKIMLSKNAAFASLAGSLSTTFSECRIICLLRDPVEAYKSQLSSIAGGIRFFGNQRFAGMYRDRFQQIFYRNYNYLIHQVSDIDNEHILIDMDDMKNNLHDLIRRAYQQWELSFSGTYDHYLKEENRKASRFCSSHDYDLDLYSIDLEIIRQRFVDIYDWRKKGITEKSKELATGSRGFAVC